MFSLPFFFLLPLALIFIWPLFPQNANMLKLINKIYIHNYELNKNVGIIKSIFIWKTATTTNLNDPHMGDLSSSTPNTIIQRYFTNKYEPNSAKLKNNQKLIKNLNGRRTTKWAFNRFHDIRAYRTHIDNL